MLHSDFDHLWPMALAGHLRHAHLRFTKPHHNTALVTSVSFSNERDE
jgi:hypothetical protein